MKSCVVRPYIEKFLSERFDCDDVKPDEEGDYAFRAGRALVSFRILDGEPGIVSVFSRLVRGVKKSLHLLEALNEFNAGVHFVKAYWEGAGTKGDVVIMADLQIDGLDDDQLGFRCELVIQVAADLGPTIKKTCGGKLAFRHEEPNADEVDV